MRGFLRKTLSWLACGLVVHLAGSAAIGTLGRVLWRQFIFIVISICRCLPVSTIRATVLPGVDFQLVLLKVVVLAGQLIRLTARAVSGRLQVDHSGCTLESTCFDNVTKVADVITDIEVIEQVTESP